MTRCKKCGGSGDMFVMKKGEQTAIIAFREIEAYKAAGYISTGSTIECSMCHGIGAVDVD